MADVNITLRKNGPYMVQDPIKVVDPQGNEFRVDEDPVFLCRCGSSSNKPFWDRTHREIDLQEINLSAMEHIGRLTSRLTQPRARPGYFGDEKEGRHQGRPPSG